MKTYILLAVVIALLVSSCYNDNYYDEPDSLSDELEDINDELIATREERDELKEELDELREELEEAGLIDEKITNPYLPNTPSYNAYKDIKAERDSYKKAIYDLPSPTKKKRELRAPLKGQHEGTDLETTLHAERLDDAIRTFTQMGIYDIESWEDKSKDLKANNEKLYEYLKGRGNRHIDNIGNYVYSQRQLQDMEDNPRHQSFINPKYYEQEEGSASKSEGGGLTASDRAIVEGARNSRIARAKKLAKRRRVTFEEALHWIEHGRYPEGHQEKYAARIAAANAGITYEEFYNEGKRAPGWPSPNDKPDDGEPVKQGTAPRKGEAIAPPGIVGSDIEGR